MTTTYTLHGQPLKVGDKVWSINENGWVDVIVDVNICGRPNGCNSLAWIAYRQHLFAWDIPPVVDLAGISPPLCWIEGHPVRKGTAMMTIHGYACAMQIADRAGATVRYANSSDGNVSMKELTFALPPNSRPMKKITLTKWFNKYPADLFGSLMPCLYASEREARLMATKHSQGQQSVTFEVEVPCG